MAHRWLLAQLGREGREGDERQRDADRPIGRAFVSELLNPGLPPGRPPAGSLEGGGHELAALVVAQQRAGRS